MVIYKSQRLWYIADHKLSKTSSKVGGVIHAQELDRHISSNFYAPPT